jgi:phosphate uptake regulator
MEVRKVQLSGGTTYTVSLPKTWARDHGIESGSLLYLSPSDDGTLIVRTDERVEDADEWEAVVDVRSFDDSILRELLAGLYVVGFDRIELRDRAGFDDGDRQRAVTDAATGLSGLDVMEATDSRMVRV